MRKLKHANKELAVLGNALNITSAFGLIPSASSFRQAQGGAGQAFAQAQHQMLSFGALNPKPSRLGPPNSVLNP